MDEDAAAQQLKLAGDESLRAQRYEEARLTYALALEQTPDDPYLLSNKSLVALKLGLHAEAVDMAEQALAILLADPSSHPATEVAKAFHRKAQAETVAGDVVHSLKTYKEGLARCGGNEGLAAAARLTLDQVNPRWLAVYWARMVASAQAPHPLSSRDGKLLKLVPQQHRMNEAQLQVHIEDMLVQDDTWMEESKDLVCAVWSEARSLGKAEVAFFRAAAYLQAGNADQAQRDAWTAIIYGPKDENDKPAWAAALMLHSAALEAGGNNVPALMDAARAVALAPVWCLAEDSVERLSRRVPEHYAEAVRSRGAAGLEDILAAERERELPPFMKPRPKYYYYYEWMRRRIEARHPELPEPVMDKLLTLDANELELLLQYPEAIDGTVKMLTGVLQEQGEAALTTAAVPLLSWEAMKEMEAKAAMPLIVGTAQEVRPSLEGVAAPSGALSAAHEAGENSGGQLLGLD